VDNRIADIIYFYKGAYEISVFKLIFFRKVILHLKVNIQKSILAFTGMRRIRYKVQKKSKTVTKQSKSPS
jgi:hypothetical protein